MPDSGDFIAVDHGDAVSSMAGRWGSMPVVRRVLFVARTLQATARLAFDVAPLIADDIRVQHCYVIDPTSHFSGSVRPFLDGLRPSVFTWEEALAEPPFDLIVSASVNANLAALRGPKLTMSHGAGHHKYRATPNGTDATVSGLSRHQLMVDGSVVPSVIALGGPRQLDDLRDGCPEAVDRAVITGDICQDRLRRNRHHRETHRRQLGVRPHQRLILLSSTWGPESLLATKPHLAARLVSELPADEYRVALVVHPNFFDHHGQTAVSGWLGPAVRAGLVLVSADEGWRAALLAADAVIGDHGSVVFYAAALEIPIAYGTFGTAEIPQHSPAAELAAAAAHLDTEAPLRPQLDALIANDDPTKRTAITNWSFADVDTSAALRRLIYRQLKLDEPPEPVSAEAFPVPRVESKDTTLHHVYIKDDDGTLWVQRYPASRLDPGWLDDATARVSVVDVRESNVDQWHGASVLLSTASDVKLIDAPEWANAILRDWPGCSIAATELNDGNLFYMTRAGHSWIASAPGVSTPTVAAAIHYRSLSVDSHKPIRLVMSNRKVLITIRTAPPVNLDGW